MIAKDIMTKDVKTVPTSMQVRDLASFLVKENISGAPVADEDGIFQGVVTEVDLIYQDKKVHLPTFLNIFSNIIPLGMGHVEEEFRKIAGTQVKDIMQNEPRTITPQTSIEDIATIMSKSPN